MNPIQQQRVLLAKRLQEMLRQGRSTPRLIDEERKILLDALALYVAEQTRAYTLCIPLRIPATHRTLASEKRFVTRFLRRWQAYWLDSQPQEDAGALELAQEERDEDAAGVFFELTFAVGRKLAAQEKQWLEEQPGVLTVFYVREDEEDFPAYPTQSSAKL